MKTWLKRNYYRICYYKKNVKFSSAVILNTKNIFEGNNTVGKNTEIVTSKLGLGTYVSDNSVIRCTTIGRFCSIGNNVQTGLGTHPSKTFVSTHPAFFSTQLQAGFSFVEKDIFEEQVFIAGSKTYVVDIGNDVWIGSNVMIMDGLKIGDGAIIAAGAIVTKDVLPYAIVAGTPAKLVRFRFTEAQIESLLQIKWWNWGYEKIKASSGLFNDISSFLTTLKAS